MGSYRWAHGDLPSAASTLDLTIAGETRTPTGCIVFTGRAVALNTNANHACLSIGYSDFTTQLCSTGNSEDDRPDTQTDTGSRAISGRVISIDDEGGQTDDKTGTVTAITGGIRLSVNAGDGSQTFRVAALIIFGGEVYVDSGGSGTADAGTTAFTHGLNGRPNFGFVSNSRYSVGVSGSHDVRSFGFFSDDGTIAQKVVGWNFQSNQLDGEAHGRVNSAMAGVEMNVGNGTMYGSWALTTNNGTSSTFTYTDQNPTVNGEDLIVMLIYDADVTAAAVSIPSPTSAAADWNYNGLSFQPQCVIMMPTMFQTEDASNTDSADAGTVSVWGFDEDGVEMSISYTDQNALSPPDTKSYLFDRLYFPRHTGATTDFEMTNPAFTADGWDILAADITDADTTTRRWIGLAIEQAPVNAGLPGFHGANRGIMRGAARGVG